MPVTTLSSRAPAPIVTFDLYRDVHKGIRAELFSLTMEAASLDPGDRADRAALAGHVHGVVDLLVAHAGHEDLVRPAIEEHLPALSQQIESDHAALDARLCELSELADDVARSDGAAVRHQVQHLHLELTSFTAAYLEHQDFEERTVMPALETALGVDAVLDVHRQIISSIPPDRFARFLAVMLPAMNVDDRSELLGGLQADAPAEVFRDAWSLAGSVLPRADHAALAHRLGINAR
jgi:hypothetical protein